jgi:hypothetical protein
MSYTVGTTLRHSPELRAAPRSATSSNSILHRRFHSAAPSTGFGTESDSTPSMAVKTLTVPQDFLRKQFTDNEPQTHVGTKLCSKSENTERLAKCVEHFPLKLSRHVSYTLCVLHDC